MILFAGTAAAKKVLKVGTIGPFNGPLAKSGVEFKGSVTMTFEKINYKAAAYKLKPVWIDSQSDPVWATSASAEAYEPLRLPAGVLNWSKAEVVAMACEDTLRFKTKSILRRGRLRQAPAGTPACQRGGRR